MINFLKKFTRNISAVAALEFAILLPLLLLLFFGSFEVARYVIATRKIDNIANDVAYILSREGDIHDADGDGVGAENGEDANRIRSIIQSVVPLMLYPYENEDYELEVRFFGMPSNTPNAGVDGEDARIMWAHCEKRLEGPGGAFEIDCDNQTGAKVTDQETAEIVSRTSEAIGSATYGTSTYFDEPDRERAKTTIGGQAYILVNFAYSYNQILKNFNNIIGFSFDDEVVEKLSTYAVRSRWIDEPTPSQPDGDGRIQPSEFRNSMFICTECNIFRSDSLTGGVGREPCAENVPAGSSVSSACEF